MKEEEEKVIIDKNTIMPCCVRAVELVMRHTSLYEGDIVMCPSHTVPREIVLMKNPNKEGQLVWRMV